MSTPIREPVHDAAAYVLGALSPEERIAFEAHLPSCDECRQEVAQLAPLNDAFAQAVPQHSPRPVLRARVLGTDAERVVAPPSAVQTWKWNWLALAASLVLTAAVGIYAARLQAQIYRLESRLSEAIAEAAAAGTLVADARRTVSESQSSLAVLAAPDLVRIDLAGQPAAPDARARALWSRNRGMVFTASSLPALPPGRVYQLWVVTATAPVSAGLLMIDPNGNASLYVQTPADIPPPTAVAVTNEPAGGVPAPTGAMYLVGTPASL